MFERTLKGMRAGVQMQIAAIEKLMALQDAPGRFGVRVLLLLREERNPAVRRKANIARLPVHGMLKLPLRPRASECSYYQLPLVQ